VGKSDLALRALDQGFVLVADDRTLVFVSGGELYGRAPDALAGLVEARGLGVLPQPSRPFCRIDLLVRCVDRPQAVERLPDPMFEVIEGVSTRVLDLWPLEPGARGKSGGCLSILESPANKRIKAARAALPGRHGLWGSRLRDQA
jgi:serine kinase of HPr protein (carbohydrate metabolism regulator)